MGHDPRIEAIKEGDLEAFRSLVDEHSPQVYAYFASRLTDAAAVDDLTQDTFVAAWQNLERYEPYKEFGAWLTGIAKNKLLNHFRSRRRRAGALERLRHEIATCTEEFLERVRGEHVRHQVGRLRRCMEDLPEDVIHERYKDYPRIVWSYYVSGRGWWAREVIIWKHL